MFIVLGGLLVVEGIADPSGTLPPNFLLNLVALADLMRLSLRERRTRELVQCCVAGNPGPNDKGECGCSQWELV